jgi:hypothetical protein
VLPLPQPWCQALRTGQDTPLSPFPFGMLILIQEFPTLPSVPRPSALQSDVSCLASGSDYPPLEGVVEGVAVGPACAASLGSGQLVLVF